MAFDWNVFRILADVCHTSSKCILVWAIHANRSAEGVSLITQIFYLIVFCARYLPPPLWQSYDHVNFYTLWNTSLKSFYTASSAYIIFLMMRVFARTRERERAWKIGLYCCATSLLTAPFAMMIFRRKRYWAFSEFLWTFSIELESICVLPQLLLLRQTTVPTVIDSFYLVTLGSYRGFYLINWLVRAIRKKSVDPVSIIFGVIQTALYIDFAWVYWSRQRVKLRGGAIVDSEDINHGWLVKRIIGQRGSNEDEEDSAAFGAHQNGANFNIFKTQPPRISQKWGPRGISVSADEGVLDATQHDSAMESLTDPKAFDDRDDNEDDAPPYHELATNSATNNVSTGNVWR